MLRRRHRDGDHHRSQGRLAQMQERSQTYESFDAVRPLKIWPGVLAHEIRGNDVAFALVELEPDTFTFTIGGETRELRPGDTYSIPGGVPHSARSGPEGTVAVDIFSPPRQDWD